MSKTANARVLYRADVYWDAFPTMVTQLDGVADEIERLWFKRVRTSHRGLGRLSSLRELMVVSPNEETIEEIGRLDQLEFLYLDSTRVESSGLEPLASCGGLRFLIVRSASRVAALEWATRMRSLETLVIQQCAKVTDLAPIGEMTTLRAFGIEGGNSAVQKVESFRPLAQLNELEALFITSCRPARDGLVPIQAMKGLRVLKTGAFYSDKEFMELRRALPRLQCDWFERIDRFGSIAAALGD